MDTFLLFVFHVCRAVFSFLFLAALWSPAWKGLTSLLSCMLSLLVFFHFPIWCPGSGVIFDCTDS